jgi:maltose O-acetyltransferase
MSAGEKSAADGARGLWHGLKAWWRGLRARLLYLLAEYESLSARPGARLPWRRRQLRSLGVRHGERFYIGRGFWIQNGDRLRFGERCSLGEFARVMDHGQISIGDDFIAATGLQVNSGTHDPVTMVPSAVPITVGNRVWCGANVTLVSGASVGDDVVIGAGSLVRGVIPSGSVAAGVPARVIRSLVRDKPLQWTLPQDGT